MLMGLFLAKWTTLLGTGRPLYRFNIELLIGSKYDGELLFVSEKLRKLFRGWRLPQVYNPNLKLCLCMVLP
jgi:hypothetical protein